ncbi:MAG: hypothetical protein M0Z52_05625 [Actinomycetota bacterium]|nr:hypothetical protein [Actinomycetota bacterium]
MSFKIINEKKPSYPVALAVVVIALSIGLLGLAAAFAYLLISGKGSNYTLGTLASLMFLFAGFELVFYARAFVPFREVSEDREEELLW